MIFRRSAITCLLTIGLLAAAGPIGAAGAAGLKLQSFNFGHARGGAIHWGAVAGRLKTYHPGGKSQIVVTKHKRKAVAGDSMGLLTVTLSLKTPFQYAGSGHAAPFLAVGDWVTANLKWAAGTPHAVALAYDDHGAPPPTADHRGWQHANSRFHGTYLKADSSSTSLVLKDEEGNSDTFTLNSDSLYFENGELVSTPMVADGQPLGVEAAQQPDGSWLANVVVFHTHAGDRGGDGQNEDFRGNYVSSTPTTLTVTGGGNSNTQRTFTLVPATAYYAADGSSVSSLAYVNGMQLRINATEQTDGTWLATSVSASHSEGYGEDHNFKGAYQSSDASSLTFVNGDGTAETFSVDANTVYFDQTGTQVSSLAYTSGETLRVTAARQADGTWLATQVSAQTGGSHQGGGDDNDFGGTYQSGTPTSITIIDESSNTDVVTLDSNTQYVDQNGNKASSLTYTAGEYLHIRAAQQPDGTWLATFVSAFHKPGHD